MITNQSIVLDSLNSRDRAKELYNNTYYFENKRCIYGRRTQIQINNTLKSVPIDIQLVKRLIQNGSSSQFELSQRAT